MSMQYSDKEFAESDSLKPAVVFYHSCRGYKVIALIDERRFLLQCIPTYGNPIHRLVNFARVVLQLIRRPDALIFDVPDMRMAFLVVISNLLGVKVICRFRGDQVTMLRAEGAVFRLRALTWAVSKIDHCIPVSQLLAGSLTKAGVRRDRISIIHTPVIGFGAAGNRPISRRDLILFITNFHFFEKVAKLPEALRCIEAVQKKLCTAYQVVIVGDGPFLEEIKNSVLLQGDNFISFVGAKSPEEVSDYYRQARLFVHCSDFDAFPSVVQEAQAMGLPVVIYGENGGKEMIVQGESGFNCEAAGEFCAVIGVLLGNERELERMSALAMENSKLWSRDRLTVEFSDVLEKICH
jgi:glycosyltransferase involved in cell wall biosynthesis